jgi:hypothetical protein
LKKSAHQIFWRIPALVSYILAGRIPALVSYILAGRIPALVFVTLWICGERPKLRQILLSCRQGDQPGFVKISPKMLPNTFFVKIDAKP